MNLTDVQVSLNAFIENRATEMGLPKTGDPAFKILPTLSGLPQTRPIWVCEMLPATTSSQRTKNLTEVVRRFQISYCTKSYFDAMKWVSHVEEVLQQNNWTLAAILSDFVFPQSIVNAVPGGALPVGTYYVAVTGLNAMDESEETLPSVAQAITTDAVNNRIQIVIPRYPGYTNAFSKYNVYMGTVATALKKTADSPINASAGMVSVVENIDAVSAGVAPPTGHIELKSFDFMKIQSSSYSGTVMREPNNEAEQYLGISSLSVVAPLRSTIESAYPVTSLSVAKTVT